MDMAVRCLAKVTEVDRLTLKLWHDYFSVKLFIGCVERTRSSPYLALKPVAQGIITQSRDKGRPAQQAAAEKRRGWQLGQQVDIF